MKFVLIADTSRLNPTLRYLQRLSRRSALAPQTRRRLGKILQAAPGALKTTTLNLDRGAAVRTRKVRVRLEFRERFIQRVAALRAFDLALRGNGRSSHWRLLS